MSYKNLPVQLAQWWTNIDCRWDLLCDSHGVPQYWGYQEGWRTYDGKEVTQ